MSNQRTQKRTSYALVLLDRIAGASTEMADLLEQERANLHMARKIYELRTKAKLSQDQLAKKVGTTQSVISRLEDADYEGHSLAMLRRIAAALKNGWKSGSCQAAGCSTFDKTPEGILP